MQRAARAQRGRQDQPARSAALRVPVGQSPGRPGRAAYLARKVGAGPRDLSTLDVWDVHLAQHGAELMAGRLELCAALGPHVAKAYAAVAAGKGAASLAYRPGVESGPDRASLATALAE